MSGDERHRELPWVYLGLPLALVAAQWWRADLLLNESVYLIGGRRLIEPEFLSQDWTFGGPLLGSTAALFQVLCVPLWALLGDPVQVALLGRLLGWVWLLSAWRALGSALGIDSRALLLGLCGFCLATQNLGAREWMFGGFEQKVVAYGFVLHSLAALARGREARAGVLAGLASCFHIIVGGWSCVALVLAALSGSNRLGWRAAYRFAWRAFAVSSPVLLIALGYLGGGDSTADPAAVSEILVRFRNPHHLDPTLFLETTRMITGPITVAAALLAANSLDDRRNRRLVLTFALALLAIYAVGIGASLTGFYRLTMFYPFRVADTLLPALFWLGCPALCWKLWQQAATSQRLLAASVAVLMTLNLATRVDNVARHVRENVASWTEEGAGIAEWRSIWAWIDANAPADAIVVAPPCEPRFSLFAGRATVALFNSAPANARVLEWHERIQALNGGAEFQTRGKRVCDEIAEGFRRLDAQDLLLLRERYGATHYLVDGERAEFEDSLIARAGSKALYSLPLSHPSAERPLDALRSVDHPPALRPASEKENRWAE